MATQRTTEIYLKIYGLALCVLLPSCVHSPLIVDRKGLDEIKFDLDLAECKTYANEVDRTATTASRAIEKAAVGGAIGAIFGDSRGAKRGTATGGVIGGYEGYRQSERDYDRVLRSCMIGRGYRVL